MEKKMKNAMEPGCIEWLDGTVEIEREREREREREGEREREMESE